MSKRRGRYLLIGAFLGFLSGLFLTHKKGSELRKETKEKFDEVKENPKEVLQETFETVKGKITDMMDSNIVDNDHIEISEDEIVISRTFDDEGDN